MVTTFFELPDDLSPQAYLSQSPFPFLIYIAQVLPSPVTEAQSELLDEHTFDPLQEEGAEDEPFAQA